MYCLPDIDENLTNYGPFLTRTVLVFQISANLKKKFFRTLDFFYRIMTMHILSRKGEKMKFKFLSLRNLITIHTQSGTQ